jgi:hypothetical protein
VISASAKGGSPVERRFDEWLLRADPDFILVKCATDFSSRNTLGLERVEARRSRLMIDSRVSLCASLSAPLRRSTEATSTHRRDVDEH